MRRHVFYPCKNCGIKFKRSTYMQRICDACKEIKLQEQKGYNKNYYNNQSFNLLRKRIFNRDDNSCKICRSTQKLNIHHWDKNHDNNKLDNLITLCYICHAGIHRIYKERSKNGVSNN